MSEKSKIDKLKAARDKWEKENAQEFQKERKKEFTNNSGMQLKRIYTPLDLEEKGFDYLEDLGFPGEYPFIRGATPAMYLRFLWGMAKYT
ncbi:MAG: Sbm, partial [Dehalococcoidia bacterium]|nr:Sbm [Dehalococcoidia bacterium]